MPSHPILACGGAVRVLDIKIRAVSSLPTARIPRGVKGLIRRILSCTRRVKMPGNASYTGDVQFALQPSTGNRSRLQPSPRCQWGLIRFCNPHPPFQAGQRQLSRATVMPVILAYQQYTIVPHPCQRILLCPFIMSTRRRSAWRRRFSSPSMTSLRGFLVPTVAYCMLGLSGFEPVERKNIVHESNAIVVIPVGVIPPIGAADVNCQFAIYAYVGAR